MDISTEPKYDVVFSYQGAFGPPTFGHLKSMEMFANQILIDYQDAANILMLFMPTALSSSKTHLEPTQNDRIVVLNKFCEILNTKYSSEPKPKITFQSSEIEYELCNERITDAAGNEKRNTDTGTYRTIDKLKTIYPSAVIILGMGKDNILQLPYWKNIDDYAKKVASIYVVNRELSEAENNTVADFSITQQPGTSLPFQKILPWSKPKTDIHRIFGITSLPDEGNYEKGGDVTTLQQHYYPSIAIALPKIVVLTESPPATSSSMLRYYIHKYINEENDKNGIKEQIKNIMFGEYRHDIDDLFGLTINGYTDKNNTYKFTEPAYDDYDNKYNEIFNNKGGKRCNNNRKKSNKRNKRTRKNRTRKNKKSKK